MSYTPEKMKDRFEKALPSNKLGSLATGGNPPYDQDMEARVAKLETDLTALKTDVAVIRSNYVTKEDLHKEISAQTWKLVTFVCGFGTALVGATYFLATHIK